MAMYESDHTKFMREWLRQHPEQIDVTTKGRALWWDKKPRNTDERRREQAAKVVQKSYYYDAN